MKIKDVLILLPVRKMNEGVRFIRAKFVICIKSGSKGPFILTSCKSLVKNRPQKVTKVMSKYHQDAFDEVFQARLLIK